MDLFDYMRETAKEKESPLASRMRPTTLEEVVGQQHIIGKGKLLYRAIKADKLSSLIFYGPPGTGKTTLAKVIANTTSAEFKQINATVAGKKDMEEVVRAAKDLQGMYGKKTILFIDEIHRFNKGQQDYLLPFVEDGTLILIGATTENPYFEVNGALISRSSIFELKPLEKEDIKKLLVRAVEDTEKGMGSFHAQIDPDALEFLAEFKQTDGKVSLGKHVVVIGGGNTAMDTARAAKRNAGVEHVYLIYRRTRRYMPADEEELVMALEDGVEFKELLSPVKLENGQLFCKVMQLSDYDVSGRRGVTETGETVWVPADTVIAAVGEKVPTDWYQANGLAVSEKGRLYVDEKTLKTSDDNVYAAGDGLYGPATVVEAIRDGRKVAEAIAGEVLARDFDKLAEEEKVYAKRGVLKEEQKETKEAGRCLGCSTICENCVEVCPNRANIAIQVPGMEKHQIIHVDYLCNECGNCKSFCPYSSAPYLDKFTLFETEADMENSKNQGFAVLDQETRRCKVRFFGKTFIWEPEKPAALPDGLGRMIETVCRDYSYLIR